jgi:hypothetical protein
MKNVIGILVLMLLVSCTKEQFNKVLVKPDSCDSIAFTFEKNIVPIFKSSCNFSACHAPNGNGDYDFTKYAIVADRIRAGTMEYRIDLPYGHALYMPQDLVLNDCDYYVLKTWIMQGYPEK